MVDRRSCDAQRSSLPNLRVEPAVADVDEEVDHDDEQSDEQHVCLHDRDVLGDTALRARLPNPGSPKTRSMIDAAAENERRLEPDDRDDRAPWRS